MVLGVEFALAVFPLARCGDDCWLPLLAGSRFSCIVPLCFRGHLLDLGNFCLLFRFNCDCGSICCPPASGDAACRGGAFRALIFAKIAILWTLRYWQHLVGKQFTNSSIAVPVAAEFSGKLDQVPPPAHGSITARAPRTLEDPTGA